MVHTRDLRYFLAVAEHQHITRAAAGLFITQPALSKQIASLERVLGVRLFDRRPDGVSLTEAGRALLPFAVQMVELGDQATRAVLRAARAATKLTIGFWVSPANEVIGAAVAAMGERCPGVRLRVRRADWSEVGAGVCSGLADVALVQTPHDATVRGTRHHRLLVEDLVVALPIGHPLLERDSVVPGDLVDETHLVLPEHAGDLGTHEYLRGGPVAALEYVTTLDETVEGVAAGLGLCVLTPSVLAARPHPGIGTVPLLGAQPGDCHLVWRPEDEDRPEIRALVVALVAAHGTWAAAAL